MYAAPNRRTTHRLAALDVPVPSWMRAPGEAPGMFGARSRHGRAGRSAAASTRSSCGSATSRRRPGDRQAVVAAATWSNACATGPRRFGWARPRPAARRTARRRMADRHRRRLLDVPDHADAAVGRDDPVLRTAATCAEIGAADLGTGAWTALPQIAADALGVPARRRRHADRRYRAAPWPRSPADRPAPAPGDRPSWSPPAPSGTSSAPAPGPRRRDHRRRRPGAQGRRSRQLRLRRAVRRGPGARRHRRDPGTAAARGLRRRAGSSTRAPPARSSSAG